MGLFDWLFRRKPAHRGPEAAAQPPQAAEAMPSASAQANSAAPPRRTKLPQPAGVRPLGEGSPMVVFDQGAAMVIMDLDAFDYTYGDFDGPDPAQRDLDALLPRVTRVCVLEGALFRGRAMGGPLLLDSRDAGAIRDLAGCLRIVEDPGTFGHCHCLGGPTLELYAGPEHLATIGLQHGRAIRWKQWYHDAQLQAGDRLTRWLQDQGVDPGRLEAIYQRGDNFLFAEAPALTERQQDARRLGARAQDRARAGQLGEALQLCTQALQTDPDQVEGYALRAEVHHHLGHLPEVVADCSAAIDRGFRHAQIYFTRAVALDGIGRTEEALADCSMALHLDPDHAGAFNSRGLIRGRLGRIDEALADFSETIRRAVDWFLPLFHRAQCHHSRGQLDAALADYDQAVERTKGTSQPRPGEGDPNLAMLYCRRGDARLDQSRTEEAEADFAQARRFHPAVALGYLGDLWLRRNQFQRAVEEFSQLIQLNPQAAQGYLGRGMAHEGLGDHEQADADLSAAIGLQPDGMGHVLRAQVRHRQGRIDEALADVSEHLRLHPEDATAFHLRSTLHKARKDLAAAYEDLQQAYRIAPDNPYTSNGLAWMLATCTDPQFRDGAHAVALARQACQASDWKNHYCLDTLAAALAETGDFDEVVRWQTQAVEQAPEEMKTSRQARLRLYQARQPCRE